MTQIVTWSQIQLRILKYYVQGFLIDTVTNFDQQW